MNDFNVVDNKELIHFHFNNKGKRALRRKKNLQLDK